MSALEVRPVALHPVIAGVRRRDHHGLRRVFRDGAGSDLRGVAPGSPSRRWARPLPLREVASDSALRAVLAVAPSPGASPRGLGLVRLDFLSWGCQRSSIAPPGSASRRPGPSPVRPVGPGSRPWLQPLASSWLPSPGPTRFARAAARWVRPSIDISVMQPLSRARGGHLLLRVRSTLPHPRRGMRSRAVRAQQMPICRRQRPVLVVSHDLDGVTAPGPLYLAASSARRVVASPRPPIDPSPLAFAGSRLVPPASPADLALPSSAPSTRRSLVRARQPILGFIEFQFVPPRAPRRLALRPEWFLPSHRCTPAPRSLHSLWLRPLTLVHHHPAASSLVSQRLRHLAAGHSVHASARPSRRCLVVLDCSCLARHCAFASQGSLDRPCPLPGAAPLSHCVSRNRSAARLRATVDSSRPQGTSAGSGPACCAPSSEDGGRSLPLCSLGLCSVRGLDRLPHPSVPQGYRRSPSSSHSGALVPVSRATHAWAASTSRRGRLQHLGGGASTHRPLPEGGVPCRFRRLPGDYSWDSSLRLRSTLGRSLAYAGLATSRILGPEKAGFWRR